MKKLLEPLKTIVLLRMGVALMALGVLLVAIPIVRDLGKPLPDLTPAEQEMFMMMGLDEGLAKKYKKYGDIVIREVLEPTNRSEYKNVVTTYYYIDDAKGGMSPIGDRRDGYLNGSLYSRSWRTIKGRGENAALWNKYTDTLAYGKTPESLGGGVQIQNLLEGSDRVNIKLKTGLLDLMDSMAVARLARAVVAIRNADAINAGIARQVKNANLADKKAQDACLNDVYVVTKIDPAGEYEMSSILGAAPAVAAYGFDGVQELHQFTIDASGKVSAVRDAPQKLNGYKITDLKACSSLR